MTKEIGDSTLIDTWGATGTKIEPDISKKNQGWTLGEFPPFEFMNWIQNVFGKKINHMLSRGVADWDTTTSYEIGATVNHTGSLWVALAANDASEPTGANTNWSEVQNAGSLETAVPAILNATGTAPIYAARAWVNFNGTGTPSIRASGNVSSVTRDGTGRYTITFTTPMPDANYAVVTSCNRDGTADSGNGPLSGGVYSSTQVQIQTSFNTSGEDTTSDRSIINVVIFR